MNTTRKYASVTLYCEVHDPQATWDEAFAASDPISREDFEDICGPRDDPWIGDCLRMILDTGSLRDGFSIHDSSAEG